MAGTRDRYSTNHCGSRAVRVLHTSVKLESSLEEVEIAPDYNCTSILELPFLEVKNTAQERSSQRAFQWQYIAIA